MSEVGEQADVTEQPYRYEGALSVGPAAYDGHIGLGHTVIIMCESVTGKRHWWTLISKHGRLPKRVKCPFCLRSATAELARNG